MSTSKRVQSPNEGGSKGFLWAVFAIIVIAVIVIGYIVWRGQANRANIAADFQRDDVTFSASWDGEGILLAAEDAAKDAPHAEIFEDFACIHCAQLAEADRESLFRALEDGKIVVTVQPMVFMDRGDTQGPSHHALAATLAAADLGDAQLYWNLRSLLFAKQSDIPSWEIDDYVNAAKNLGASDEIQNAIRDEKYLDKANEVGEQRAERLQKIGESVSSPRVFVNDKEIELSNDWVEKVIG